MEKVAVVGNRIIINKDKPQTDIGGIALGKKVIINRNLKSGDIVGKVKSKDKILYVVRLKDHETKESLGDYIYTEKQITVRNDKKTIAVKQ